MNTPSLGPEYLHAEVFLQNGEWREYPLTIKEVIAPDTIKSADGKYIDKPILAFSETEKMLVLGKTNERLATCALGTGKPKEWIGKKITLYPVRENWFGQKNVAAIRVRIPEGKTRPFIQPKSMGKDITGTKQVEVAQ